MSQVDTQYLADALELAEILRPTWPTIDARLRASGALLNEGEAGGEGGKAGEGGGEGAGGGKKTEPETFDREYVENLRRENAGYRTRATKAESRVQELEQEGLSEVEKLKKEAEEGNARGESGTQKLRRANLVLALGEKGLSGGRAKAAAKLLDTVEYDDGDEPTNLDAAIKTAEKAYGAELFTAEGKTPTTFDGGARSTAAKTTDPDAAIRAMAGR